MRARLSEDRIEYGSISASTGRILSREFMIQEDIERVFPHAFRASVASSIDCNQFRNGDSVSRQLENVSECDATDIKVFVRASWLSGEFNVKCRIIKWYRRCRCRRRRAAPLVNGSHNRSSMLVAQSGNRRRDIFFSNSRAGKTRQVSDTKPVRTGGVASFNAESFYPCLRRCGLEA